MDISKIPLFSTTIKGGQKGFHDDDAHAGGLELSLARARVDP